MVGLATRVWQHAGLAGATTDAVPQAAPPPGSTSTARRSTSSRPRLTADEPSLRRRSGRRSLDRDRAVRFDYQRSGGQAGRHPHLQPWGVVPLLRPLVRRRPRRRPRRGAGVPALPGARRRPPRSAGRRLRGARGHRPARADPAARAAAPPTPAAPLVRRGSRPRRCAAAAADAWRPASPGPTAPTAWDRLTVDHRGRRSPTRSLAYGADVVRRGAGRAARERRRRLRAAAGDAVRAAS